MDTLEKLLNKTTISENGCFIWNGAKDKDGYGRHGGKGRTNLVHRFVWEETNKEILSLNVSVCHKCDTPSCINPDHLFSGTHGDNMRDKVQKGRNRSGNEGKISVTEDQLNKICDRTNKINDLVKETGISRATLCRYRSLFS